MDWLVDWIVNELKNSIKLHFKLLIVTKYALKNKVIKSRVKT
jgi:hypothetical protein